MSSASRLRRGAALLATTTLGVSTALLTVSGAAQAAGLDVTTAGTSATETVTVPSGVCAITWTIMGGAGGQGDATPHPSLGVQRTVTTTVTAGDVFVLAAGAPGKDSADGGAGGLNPRNQGQPSPDFGGASGGSASGGGGAASVVLQNGAVYLAADGGSGGGAQGGAGGSAVPSGAAQIVPGSEQVGGSMGTEGYIDGEGVACPDTSTPPAAPVKVLPAAGSAGEIHVYFDPAPAGSASAVTGWEYSLGGGTWTNVTTQPGFFAERQFVLTNLTPGQLYGIRVRATSAAGPGAASAEVPMRAGVVRIGAPTGVAVEPGPSSLTVRWSPPSAAGTFPVNGYRVTVQGVSLKDAIEACPVDANARSCVVPVPAGHSYTVSVSAVDTIGAWGGSASAFSGLVPAPVIPAGVPAKDDDLRGASGAAIDKVAAGKTVVLKGSGYAPFSTVRAIAYSTPTELGTFVTDANGEFEVTVTIPAGLPAGDHSLVVTGVDRAGQVRNLRVDVTVSAAGAAPQITGARLANTGADVAVPLTGGLVALVAGTGLTLAARRRAPRVQG